jgi:hypothetical protein
MKFNVNFLGHIPYNPDNLHRPQNEKQDSKPPLVPSISSGRLLSFSLHEMMKLYWTVRSFKINVSAQVTDTLDPFAQFIAAGGTSGGIIGASAGLVAAQQNQKNGFLSAVGYTKVYSKYNKKVRKSREGIINGITQSSFNNLEEKSLDLDKEIDPNKLEGYIYGTNEGTLCSAGPVHVFQQGNVSIILDFSDILYFSLRPTGSRFYWPKITIFISVPNSGASFGNQISSQVISTPSTIGRINQPLSFINLNFPGASNNLGTTQINSVLFNTQIANVNIDIRPGDRCCDRFFWDGKDTLFNKDDDDKKYRETDDVTKTPKENSEEFCEDVCGYADPDPIKKLSGGVYMKRVEKENKSSAT